MTAFTIANTKNIQKTNFKTMKDFLDYGIQNWLFSEVWELNYDKLSIDTQQKIQNRKNYSHLINI